MTDLLAVPGPASTTLILAASATALSDRADRHDMVPERGIPDAGQPYMARAPLLRGRVSSAPRTDPERAGDLPARLGLLLADLPQKAVQRLAGGLSATLRQAAETHWARLAQRVAACLPAEVASHWRAQTLVPPAPPPLPMAFLAALLLALRLQPRARLRTTLFGYADPLVREQALCGDIAPHAVLMALDEALSNWASRHIEAVARRAEGLSPEAHERLQREISLPVSPLEAGVADDMSVDLSTMLRAGAASQAASLLASRAGVPAALVETAVALRERSTLLELCRDGGCDENETQAVLLQLAGLSPEEASFDLAGLDPTWLRGALREMVELR